MSGYLFIYARPSFQIKNKASEKTGKDKMMFKGFGNMLIRPIDLSIFTAMITKDIIKSA